jgi:serine/tyrosine/threonine adenylyltransferase
MTITLNELPWESRFVQQFPGDPDTRNFVRGVRNVLYSEVRPTPVANPSLIGWADRFAEQLGIARPGAGDVQSVELLAGNRVLPGMRPYAARYGGHQFGQWAGQLGDGRAITLGEVAFPHRGRWEFQLKGAGPTPYARGADGRAVLRSSLREFLCSEAMYFLGVPTTRALSLVRTGDTVIRDMFYDGNPVAEPGAIVCRVAPSFLRFGNFEILTASGEHDLLRRLADFLIADHYPELDTSDPDVYGKLMDEISRRTAEMIVHWQRVGFVHGVMNTDNMSALGLTIDYGPYGWLEPYDVDWTPNTTDAHSRRYRFGNQPAMAMWNLGRLATALFPLINDEHRIYKSLELFRDTFQRSHDEMLMAKLGLTAISAEEDRYLVDETLSLLQAAETDYTIFFRGLSDWRAKEDGANPDEFLALISPAFYAEPEPALRQRWSDWARRYAARVKRDDVSDAERIGRMKRTNPKYVLRNYLAQNAITAAERGDLSVLERLLRVLERPYDEQPGEDDLAARRPEWARTAPGCSALSCSS